MVVVARLVPSPGLMGAVLLRLGEYRVGRTTDCHVFLEDQSVSRVHAMLVVGGSRTVVRDNASRNGTFVAGRRVAEVELADGVEVLFGAVRFKYERVDVAGDVPSTSSGCGAPVPPDWPISPAERRVFDLLLCAHGEKAIALELSLSPNTVHNHVKRIYRAFGVHSRSELLTRVLGAETR